jgi:hypothetical protein
MSGLTWPVPAVALAGAVLSLGIVACGSSSSTSSQSATTAPTATTAPGQSAGGTASVSTGPVRGVLHAANHAPRVNRLWNYSVHATDAAGHPLSGTVEIQFVYGSQVVGRDTPPSHPLKGGRWQDKIKFPAAALGMLLTFRAVVHGGQGSITLDWPVTVTQ